MEMSVRRNTSDPNMGTITINDAVTITIEYSDANDTGHELINAYRDLFNNEDYLKHLSMYLDSRDVETLRELTSNHE